MTLLTCPQCGEEDGIDAEIENDMEGDGIWAMHVTRLGDYELLCICTELSGESEDIITRQLMEMGPSEPDYYDD